MSGHRDTIVVATTNRGKLEELRSMLADLPVQVISSADALKHPPVVAEDGATLADNAVKKAQAIARATLMLTVADDSGLEVDALDGRPGVRSARFAHDRATDAENNATLIAALERLGDRGPDAATVRGDRFPARFRCVLAFVDPFTHGGAAQVVEGVCEGAITLTARGSGGFGYDPLFVIGGGDRTLAELTEEEKNRVSHRARAFAGLRPLIERSLRERAAQVGRAG